MIARYKHFSLFGLVVSNEEKKFYNIDNSFTTLSEASSYNMSFLKQLNAILFYKF